MSDDRFEALRRELQYDKTTAGFILEAVDAADKAAGVYRVSLDAAIEAAARARFAGYHLATMDWDKLTEASREEWRRKVRDIVTAAVMGGAQ